MMFSSSLIFLNLWKLREIHNGFELNSNMDWLAELSLRIFMMAIKKDKQRERKTLKWRKNWSV